MAIQYVTHTVTDGDTIQLIGKKYNVDWNEIVSLNNLEYPYVVADVTDVIYINTDTVASVGSKLIVPTDTSAITNTNGSSSENIDLYAFGGDIDIYQGIVEDRKVIKFPVAGELSSEKADLRVVTGIENLRQQLITRLGTRKGSLPLHPEFGSNIYNYIGSKVTEELVIKTQLEVAECLTTDPRVSDLSDITVVFTNGGLHVECSVIPVPPYSSFDIDFTYQ